LRSGRFGHDVGLDQRLDQHRTLDVEGAVEADIGAPAVEPRQAVWVSEVWTSVATHDASLEPEAVSVS